MDLRMGRGRPALVPGKDRIEFELKAVGGNSSSDYHVTSSLVFVSLIQIHQKCLRVGKLSPKMQGK